MGVPNNQDIGFQTDIVIKARFDLEEARNSFEPRLNKMKGLISSISSKMQSEKLEFDIDTSNTKAKIASIKQQMEGLIGRKGVVDQKKLNSLKTKELQLTKRIASLSNKKAISRNKGLLTANRIEQKSVSGRTGGTFGFDKQAYQDLKRQRGMLESDLRVSSEAHSTKMQGLNGQLISAKSNYSGLQKKVSGTLQPMKVGLSKANKDLAIMNNEAKKNSRQFAGWAMSLMFFGMALQRASMAIWQMGNKSFREINESVEDSVNGFQQMEGATKYLGFTIGAALEPVTAFLIPIIDKMSDWVATHEGLTRVLTSTGIVLGSLFFVGGTGVLAINGFIELGLKMGLIKAEALKMQNFNWKGMFNKIAGAAAIIVGISFIMKGVEEWKDGKWLDGLLGTAGGALVTAGGIQLMRGGKGAPWFIVIGVVLKALGDNDFLRDIMSTIAIADSLLGSMLNKMSYKVANNAGEAIADVLNTVIDAIPSAILYFLGLGDYMGGVTYTPQEEPAWNTDRMDYLDEQLAMIDRQLAEFQSAKDRAQLTSEDIRFDENDVLNKMGLGIEDLSMIGSSMNLTNAQLMNLLLKGDTLRESQGKDLISDELYKLIQDLYTQTAQSGEVHIDNLILPPSADIESLLIELKRAVI